MNAACTPLGKSVAERPTLPLKPFNGVTVIVLVPWPPCAILSAFGAADSLKFGAGVTVRLMEVVWLKLPEMPFTVTVATPRVAVALAVKVSVLLLVAGLELNAEFTPLGKPVAERVTLPLKPFNAVMVTVLVPCPPCTTLNLFGAAESLKPGAAATVRLIVVVCVKLPETPVTVTVAAPVVAVALAVKVIVLLLVAGLGLNAARTPLGKPDAERVTLLLKPFNGVIVIALFPWPPWATVNVFGAADSL